MTGKNVPESGTEKPPKRKSSQPWATKRKKEYMTGKNVPKNGTENPPKKEQSQPQMTKKSVRKNAYRVREILEKSGTKKCTVNCETTRELKINCTTH